MLTDKQTLRGYFSSRKRPTQAHFHEWLDSYIHKGGEDGIFLDANGNIGNIGIGTKTPERALHILGTGLEDDDVAIESRGNTANSGTLIFDRSRENLAPPEPGDTLGLILFRGKINGATTRRAAAIEAVAESNFSGAVTGSLRFKTNNDGSIETERMRIDQNGNVGIGTTEPTSKLQVNGDIKANAIDTVSIINSIDSGGIGAPGKIVSIANNGGAVVIGSSERGIVSLVVNGDLFVTGNLTVNGDLVVRGNARKSGGGPWEEL